MHNFGNYNNEMTEESWQWKSLDKISTILVIITVFNL